MGDRAPPMGLFEGRGRPPRGFDDRFPRGREMGGFGPKPLMSLRSGPGGPDRGMNGPGPRGRPGGPYDGPRESFPGRPFDPRSPSPPGGRFDPRGPSRPGPPGPVIRDMVEYIKDRIAHEVEVRRPDLLKDTEGRRGDFPSDMEGRPRSDFPRDIEDRPRGDFPRDMEGRPRGDIPRDMDGRPRGDFPRDMEGRPRGDLPRDMEGRPRGDLPRDMEGRPRGDLPRDIEGRPRGDLPRDMEGRPRGDLPRDMEGRPRGDFPRDMEGRPRGDFPRDMEGRPRADFGSEMEGRARGDFGRELDGRPRMEGRPSMDLPRDMEGRGRGDLARDMVGRPPRDLASDLPTRDAPRDFSREMDGGRGEFLRDVGIRDFEGRREVPREIDSRRGDFLGDREPVRAEFPREMDARRSEFSKDLGGRGDEWLAEMDGRRGDWVKEMDGRRADLPKEVDFRRPDWDKDLAARRADWPQLDSRRADWSQPPSRRSRSRSPLRQPHPSPMGLTPSQRPGPAQPDKASEGRFRAPDKPLQTHGLKIQNFPIDVDDEVLQQTLFQKFRKYGFVSSVEVHGQGEDRYALVFFYRQQDQVDALIKGRRDDLLGRLAKITPYIGRETKGSGRPLTDWDEKTDEFHPRASRTLLINNLDRTITPEKLGSVCERFGDVLDVEMCRAHDAGPTRSAFVEFCDMFSVCRAGKALDGEVFGKYRIKTEFGKSVVTSCVWLDGLPLEVTQEFLMQRFSRYGQVAKAVHDRLRGRALVLYTRKEDAVTAVQELRGTQISGWRVKVDFASDRSRLIFCRDMEESGQDTGDFLFV